MIRISFNITFLIIGLFSTVAGASDSSTTLIFLASVWSIGVGGNVPNMGLNGRKEVVKSLAAHEDDILLRSGCAYSQKYAHLL